MSKPGNLDALVSQIPENCATTPTLHCCCGSLDCQYLRHSNQALDHLEEDVRTAAQLGQALLHRHEQYMHDAERERMQLNEKIEKLETDKKALESQNARTVEENRELLNQLEGLNATVSESDTQIKTLEATLQSSQQEIKRLEGLVTRTYDLEIQLAALEQEQDVLQKTITTTEAEERSAIQRWKKAERRLYDLQEQLERIEREAHEERERHVEVLGRMERQRAVEKELDTAAGRLKGAAAATTGNGKNGSSVVSHFVKDILQDNANLQLGIVELREMLMNSNDEVETLREQLLIHQPLADVTDSGPPTLGAELAAKEPKEERLEPPVISQALHIHHHYHTPKKEEVRRPKKKRTSLNTSLFTPPQTFQGPRTPRGPETASAILSQTSVTIPTPNTPLSNRWSMQSGQMSDFAPSSVPSSPQSNYRNSNFYDRFDMDSSRPTSPGSSVDPMSPQSAPHRHRKKGSEVSNRSFIPSSNFQPHNAIKEEDDDVDEISSLQSPSMPSLSDDSMPYVVSHEPEFETQEWTTSMPSLRRSTSHESILSISGIDIHTLKSRPSQITITSGNALLRPRSRVAASLTMASIDTVTALPILSRQGYNSTAYLRSSIGAPPSSDTRSISSSGSGDGIGKKVGGWVFGRWGVSPTKSSGDLKAAAAIEKDAAPSPTQRPTASLVSPVSSPAIDPLQKFMGRSPGINQKGPVPGFLKRADKAPSMVKPNTVDTNALREILMEGTMQS